MTVALFLIAASVFALAFVIWWEARLLRKDLVELGGAVDQLRLTSRARINSVATADNPAGEARLTRVSRTAIGKRVVVGGSESSKQRKDLEHNLQSKRE
jgi:hypothetical protein